jgi:iron complex outermembrane receptor protein
MKTQMNKKCRSRLKLTLIASVCLTGSAATFAQQSDAGASSAPSVTADPNATSGTDQKAAPRSASGKTSDIGTVKITGSDNQIGNGLIVQEDSVKARSNVTRAEIEKERSTSNAFQDMDLLPGVNTYSYDATGLFGGGLSIRGFDVSQLGFTINGVPINDSGSYSVYPSELVDVQNLCTQSVAQGATDIDAPHIGATGGNIALVTCDPEDKYRFRVSQTVGGLDLSNSYARVDTGRFMNGRASAYFSYSYATADKWKGLGDAKRNHIDSGLRFDLDHGNYITATVMYNRMVNNNIYDPTLAQLEKYGYYYDYATTYTGTKQSPAYYKLSLNPFENVIASAAGVFRLTPDTQLKIQPYLWYGYGTGGSQQTVLNGVVVASSSVTRTQRPGITATLTHDWENHQFLAGLWFERAIQRQTGPAVAVDSDGTSTNPWLNSDYLLNSDGSVYESRNYKTITTSWQAFAQDTISLLNDRLSVVAGFRAPFTNRDFTNYASSDSSYTVGKYNYNFSNSYSAFLPQLGGRFLLTNDQQIFFNAARNFRAPPNYALEPSDGNVALVDGKVEVVGSVKAETSNVVDLGYRLQQNWGTFSGTLFYVDYQNRQAVAYNPNTDISQYTNAGSVRNYGFELEAGSKPIDGWSVYASLTHNHSVQLDNLLTSSGTLQTAGKEYPLDPDWLFGLSLQYEQSHWYARLKGKLTGSTYATLTDDERVPAYMTFDFDAGYRFDDMYFIKKPTVRLNVSNIFNRQYRNAASLANNSAAGVYYYLGAPRLISMTFSADF